MNSLDIEDALISIALDEDLSQRGDVTSQALISKNTNIELAIVSRSRGVLSGAAIAEKTLKKVDNNIGILWTKHDGDSVNAGDVIAELSGNQRSLLSAERTTLNFLQHLSGIATLTRRFVDELIKVQSTTIVRDTRKTLPGYRSLEKAAVVHGGGQNHRMGLYDAFLVKDNHIAQNNLEIITQRCRDFDPSLPLEIEVDNLEQLKVVLRYEPDVILLDNFDVDDVIQAIGLAEGIDLEISGGVNLQNISQYGKTNVKYIAIGSLTHSAPALDLGFDAL